MRADAVGEADALGEADAVGEADALGEGSVVLPACAEGLGLLPAAAGLPLDVGEPLFDAGAGALGIGETPLDAGDGEPVGVVVTMVPLVGESTRPFGLNRSGR